MPLYLDEHEHIPGLTAEAVASAHARDLEVQGGYGVSYLRYWYDEATGKVFCLVDAPSPEVAPRCIAWHTGSWPIGWSRSRKGPSQGRGRRPRQGPSPGPRGAPPGRLASAPSSSDARKR